MIRIPNPDYMTLAQWVSELNKQDGTIPKLNGPWRDWANSLQMTSRYKYVGTQGYDTWRDWARVFLMVNQGV
mgnify:CR=1 FL=1